MRNVTSNKQPLVSILTPCYNGEKFVHRFLDSVLNQTYGNMELIFINDGSTDNTEEIVLSYKSKFENHGIDFTYLYQENKGQAAALNQGLKIFKGEYLTWPDSDDILHEDNIKKRLEFLEQNRKFNIVLCDSQFVDKNGKKLGLLKRMPPKDKDYLFNDLIVEKNACFAGGAYMVRTNTFRENNPDKYIYESRGGQNWQMLLPIVYKNECGYLEQTLYYIFVRPGSHSRQDISLNDKINKCYMHQDILNNVIESINKMPNSEKDYWLTVIEKKYDLKRFIIASKERDAKVLEKYYSTYKEKYQVNAIDRLRYLEGKYVLVYYIGFITRLPFRFIRKIKRLII